MRSNIVTLAYIKEVRVYCILIEIVIYVKAGNVNNAGIIVIIIPI